MFVFARAITFSALFIGLVLVYAPARILAWTGMAKPAVMGMSQALGILFGAVGSLIALWCIFSFAAEGKGTPAPFDPPRRLVAVGPYRYVRNPMYIGAGLALAGAALFYQSWSLLGYTGVFLLVAQLFVFIYEEPILRRNFGRDYDNYCARTGRWWPRW